jgi:uncharacterized protein (DUF1800 family)
MDMNPESNPIEPLSLSMAPYNGAWTQREAAHLLRRALIGPTFQQIQNAVSNGMNSTVSNLLTTPTIGVPLAYDSDDTETNIGDTWINNVYPQGDTNPAQNARQRSLAAWLTERQLTNNSSLAEKMSLFWQNHFAARNSGDARADYDYFKLLYNSALGNFKQLVKDITVSPTMLIFLNGNSNTKNSPNENYSRELLELYTIGKGPQIAPGDYTHYTEEDIAAGAKILTGWRIANFRSQTDPDVLAYFDAAKHDDNPKVLSSKFNSTVIQPNGANEYSDYIEVIFQQDQVARHICKKIYRFFVNYDMTPEVENNVIPVMVQTFKNANYNISPVMELLFKSEHFYDLALRGSQIKSPIEFLAGLFSSSASHPVYDVETKYKMNLNLYYRLNNLDQSIIAPPSVGGWPAYYQAPAYSKLWLNSTSIKNRFSYSDNYTIYNGYNFNSNRFKVKALNIVNALSIPNDAVSVINDLCLIYFPKEIAQADKDALKSILTNGLPDFEWTIQYNDYQNNPNDSTYSDPVRIRVEQVLGQMCKMAQFHTF